MYRVTGSFVYNTHQTRLCLGCHGSGYMAKSLGVGIFHIPVFFVKKGYDISNSHGCTELTTLTRHLNFRVIIIYAMRKKHYKNMGIAMPLESYDFHQLLIPP